MFNRLPVILCLIVLLMSTCLLFGFDYDYNQEYGGGRAGQKLVNIVPILGQWSSLSMAFGNQTTGRDKILSNSFGNTAINTLAYGEDIRVTVTGAAFRVYTSKTFGNLSAGRRWPVRVAFRPPAQQNYSGHITYSAPNIPAVSAALTGAGVSTDPYSAYFSNNFGCADSGTVYTCADPNAFTSETDAGSIGAISGGKFVITYNGATSGALVQKNSLAAHSNISLRARARVSNTTFFASTGNAAVVAVRDSTSGSNIQIQLSASGGTGVLNQWRTIYGNGSNTTTPTTNSYTFNADTDYDIVANIKTSTTTSSNDGSFVLIVNGTTIQNLTGINTYKTSYDQLQVGSGSVTTSAERILSIDNVWLGYK